MESLKSLVDEGSFIPASDGLTTRDPLEYPAYEESLAEARSEGGDESVVSGRATISGRDVEVAAFDFSFLGGSMGEVAGERLARSMRRATDRKVPFILRTATGGARMQEGMRSLVQMPKLVAARVGLAESHCPFIAVLGHPTTGGVLASLGALADITIAESGATIGFSGPRLVEMFTGRSIASDSHTAFSALGNGLIDAIAEGDASATVAHALSILAPDEPLEIDPPPEITVGALPDGWIAYERVRDAGRPLGPELAREISDSLFLLRGDRAGGEDLAVSGAFARIAGRRCVLIALDRSINPGPAAYRKACRCLDLAARLNIPVVTLIDTSGADPSEDSEAGGIAWAIAELFRKMLQAPVPTLSIVTGEGGSGGALAFAVADLLLATEDSVFSVIGPEAAAEILFRDPSRAPEAARLLRPTAQDLVRLGIADGLIPGPLDADSLRSAIAYHLGVLTVQGLDPATRSAARHARWRADGG